MGGGTDSPSARPAHIARMDPDQAPPARLTARAWVGRLQAWLDELRLREHQLTFVLSVVIGATVGLVVVAFILVTSRIGARLHPANGAAWWRLIVPVAGALSSGALLWNVFPNARGSGIPQTKAALVIHNGYISFRTVVGKFLCCSVSLASGIALGREGPSVQIGAGLASTIGRRLKLSTEQVKALLPVGGAAALAAAFNTPIAAVLFTLEEIVGDLHAPVLGAVVLSAATSWMVLHLLLGDDPLFHVTAYRLVSPLEFIAYIVLGIVGGLASAAFVNLLLGLRRWFLALPRASLWWQPAVGGLVVGAMGFFLPDVLGVGYGAVEKVLAGDFVLRVVVLLAVFKLIATAVCYASGNAGGIFGPSLFIGAMVGASVGSVAHTLFPAHTATAGAYALVGMGALFAGVIRTPMTSVIMIFELTRDYSIIVPLMLANLIAFYVSHRLQPDPIYEALAHQDGIHLPSATAREHADRWRVQTVMRRADDLAPAELTAAREQLAAGGAHVHVDHTLSLVLERMGATGARSVAVVHRANVSDVLGVVTLEDVLAVYGLSREGPPAGSAERR